MPGHFDDLSGHAMYNLSCCFVNLPLQVTRDSCSTSTSMALTAPLGTIIATVRAIPGKGKTAFLSFYFCLSSLTYIVKIIFPVTLSDIIIKPIVGYTG